MHIALSYSRQLGNDYTGAAGGPSDSEATHMETLARQVEPLLTSAGIRVSLNPGTDINRDGSLSYKDSVAWSKTGPQASADVLIELHSNAVGDALVMFGTSSASARYGAAMRAALATYCPMPYGDTWTLSTDKVAILTDSPMPAVLIEVGRHDQLAYAEWLRAHIADGSLARMIASAIVSATTGGTLPAAPPPPAAPAAANAAQLVQTIAAAAAQLKDLIK